MVGLPRRIVQGDLFDRLLIRSVAWSDWLVGGRWGWGWHDCPTVRPNRSGSHRRSAASELTARASAAKSLRSVRVVDSWSMTNRRSIPTLGLSVAIGRQGNAVRWCSGSRHGSRPAGPRRREDLLENRRGSRSGPGGLKGCSPKPSGRRPAQARAPAVAGEAELSTLILCRAIHEAAWEQSHAGTVPGGLVTGCGWLISCFFSTCYASKAGSRQTRVTVRCGVAATAVRAGCGPAATERCFLETPPRRWVSRGNAERSGGAVWESVMRFKRDCAVVFAVRGDVT